MTLVYNKIDLTGDWPRESSRGRLARSEYVSARTGAGVDPLREHLKSSAGYRDGRSGALRHADGISMRSAARTPWWRTRAGL